MGVGDIHNISKNIIENFGGIKRPDGLYDFPGDVDISNKKPYWISKIFGKIKGDFICSENNFNSLDDCSEVIGDDLDCSCNQLQSLEYGQNIIGRDFWCGNNLVQFTEEDVIMMININGRGYV